MLSKAKQHKAQGGSRPPCGKEKEMVKLRIIRKIINKEERFTFEYVFYLSDGRIITKPFRSEPRGWKTLKGALNYADKWGRYEVENREEYAE